MDPSCKKRKCDRRCIENMNDAARERNFDVCIQRRLRCAVVVVAVEKRTKNEGSPVYLVIVVDAVSHGAGFQLRNHNPSDVLDLILASHFVPTGKKWMKIAML
jgi:hypothetical protein